jgi:hypothetical protein
MSSPRLGASVARILSQNLELQEFCESGRKRQRVREIMRDMTQRDGDQEKERARKIKRDRQTYRVCEKDSEREKDSQKDRESEKDRGGGREEIERKKER